MERCVLIPHWVEVETPVFNSRAFYSKKNGVQVIVSTERHLDERWLHVSLSKRNRLPSWKNLKEVKDIFIGYDKKAIMVLPEDSEYVNFHPYCLHLFCNLDRDPLPDFTGGTGMI